VGSLLLRSGTRNDLSIVEIDCKLPSPSIGGTQRTPLRNQEASATAPFTVSAISVTASTKASSVPSKARNPVLVRLDRARNVFGAPVKATLLSCQFACDTFRTAA
jgi:hypothetical protein